MCIRDSFLRRKGHAVTVYDAMPRMGGMLRYGIPDYRLPASVLDRELSVLEQMGIVFRNGARLGDGLQLSNLEAEYDAVFLALGAWNPYRLGIPGEDRTAVIQGIDFLRRLNQGDRAPLPERVAVIGGGNTAMDAARSARRLGSEVTVLYRRTIDEMPATRREIDEAEEEGVTFRYLTQPVAFLGKDDALEGIRCVQMKLGEPDASGRRRPVAISDSEFVVPADAAILAVGQGPDTACLGAGPVEVDGRGCIVADRATGQTTSAKVFAGGDAVTGASIAVEAVGAGHRAADAMDRFLRGAAVPPAFEYEHEKQDVRRADIPDVAETPQIHTAVRSPEARVVDFAEYETSFTEDEARAEGQRCLECGCERLADCSLRDCATMVRASQATFAGELDRCLPDLRHPYIVRDPGKCVACGRCIRTCGEVCGIHAIDFVDRGIGVEVQAPFDRAWQDSACVSCGACVDTCPTGALTDRKALDKQLPCALADTPSVCTLCSLTCAIRVQSLAGRLMKTLPGSPSDILCAKGRYGWQGFVRAERLTRPLIRRGNRLVEATWKEAFAKIRESLPANKEETVVVAGGHLTQQATAVLARLAADGLRTQRLRLERLDGTEIALGSVAQRAGIAALPSGRCLLVVGPRSRYERFVVDLALRAAQRAGSTLVSLAADLPDADLACEATPPDALLRGLHGQGEEPVPAELQDLVEANDPILVFETRTVSERTLAAISGLLAARSDWRYLPIGGLANETGLRSLGFTAAADTAPVAACLAVGADPAATPGGMERLAGATCIVAASPIHNATTELAHVVLPLPLPLEEAGVRIDADGALREAMSTLRNPAGRTTVQTLTDLATALGLEVGSAASATPAQTRPAATPGLITIATVDPLATAAERLLIDQGI